MAISTQDIELNDPLRNIGPDSTAVFDESSRNSTDYGSSENLSVASKLEDDDEEEEDEDDDLDLDDEEDDDDEDEEEDDDDEDDEEEDDEDEDEDETPVTKRR
jgi:hypothetical protein